MHITKSKFITASVIIVKIAITAIFLSTIVMFSGCIGEEIQSDPNKYERIYEQPSGLSHEFDMLGFGEYHYNSYMILFPRQKPQTIEDFYYHVSPGMDMDSHLIYFTYYLEEEEFPVVAEKMKNFTVSLNGETNSVIYDEEHFEYPAVILSWGSARSVKYCPKEYILLDYDNSRLINVYFLCRQSAYSEIGKKYPVNISSNSNDLVPAGWANFKWAGYYKDSYSIYQFSGIGSLSEMEYVLPF